MASVWIKLTKQQEQGFIKFIGLEVAKIQESNPKSVWRRRGWALIQIWCRIGKAPKNIPLPNPISPKPPHSKHLTPPSQTSTTSWAYNLSIYDRTLSITFHLEGAFHWEEGELLNPSFTRNTKQDSFGQGKFYPMAEITTEGELQERNRRDRCQLTGELSRTMFREKIV